MERTNILLSLDLRGVPPRPHPSEGVGEHHHLFFSSS